MNMFSYYITTHFITSNKWKFKMCIKHLWMFRPPIYKIPIQA